MTPAITILVNLTDIDPEVQLFQLSTNLELAGIDFNLAVYNNGNNSFISEFTSKLGYKLKVKTISSVYNLSNPEALNLLMREVETQFICLLPANVFCQQNWLYDLLYYQTTIERSGIVGVSMELCKGYATSYLNESGDLEKVFVNNENTVVGPVLFSLNLMNELGALNEDMHNGNEIIEYSHRSTKTGRYNYYIKEQNAISVGAFKSIWQTTEADLSLITKTPLFRKLYEMTANQLAAWDQIDSLVKKMYAKAKKTTNNSTSNFGIESQLFRPADLKHIEVYANKFELAYSFINPSSIYNIKVVFFNP